MKAVKLFVIPLIFHQYCIAQKLDSITPTSKKVTMRIFPNPVKTKFVMQLFNFEAGEILVTIVDKSGVIVYNEKRLVVLKKDEVTIFISLKSGNYWCLAKQKDRVAKGQLVVIQ